MAKDSVSSGVTQPEMTGNSTDATAGNPDTVVNSSASNNSVAFNADVGHNTTATSNHTPETSVSLPDLAKELAKQHSGASGNGIDLLKDVELNVKIELGRTKMYVEDVLKLSEGSVVELDKLAGDPVDIFVNERLVARGEVLVLNDNFCVRVNQIVADIVA
jgi:flagellar motor switch protein FliN